jgi:hypothetical protein
VALTTTQRSDMQADFGIGSDEAVFTNDQLDRLYARADSDYDLAVAIGFDQLLANVARYYDYKQAETQEAKAQIFDHLEKMANRWHRKAGGGLMPLTAGTIELDFIEPDGTGSEYS